ncbi:oxidoreductase [Amantichitinum ursilacus]|uniref:3-oxoacyl-[acyl-carrier-protein] reductase FabG n=1 Tax=Amantichitinum ursilacus TaxID=857265 RepID=A0A0N0XJE6_9NEIS|nr:oxidoreductase [Amantichitinum ursilacus]KPC53729.1 3-oxoacyl-[acyl-carrier-protein] reductase FabG [Amantichitinum ursilacus]
MSKVWFITGANRGLGAEIAKAALAHGDRVVGTARNPAQLHATLGATEEQLLALALDVTRIEQLQPAVEAAVARFGRIDVLVNNAGYGQLGVFEEIDAAAIQKQFATNVFGLIEMTRAVLPVMRKQRSGHIFNLSSIAGLRAPPGAAIYGATKWAVEGFSEVLALETAQFGIKITIIEPGAFRTDFLHETSAHYATHTVPDYAEFAAHLASGYATRNHKQPGDPARLGAVVLQLANAATPPMRFPVGSDAVKIAQDKIDSRSAELAQWRDLAASTDFPA